MKLNEELTRMKQIMGLINESDENNFGKIFILVGPPSVGKSTWIRNYPEFQDEQPYVINRDDITEEVASSYNLTYDDMFAKPSPDENIGDEHPKYGKVIESPPQIQQYQKLSYDKVLDANNEINQKLADKFSNASGNKYIVVDMTNMSKFARKNAIDKLSPILPEYEKVAVVFNFQGGEDLIKKMAQKRSDEYKSMGKSKTIPPEAFDRMFSSYQDVSPEEGFDDIISVDNIPSFRNIGLTEKKSVDIIKKQLVTEQPGKIVAKIMKAIGKAMGTTGDDVAKVVSRNAREHLSRLTKYVSQLEQRFSHETIDELSEFLNTSLIEGQTVVRNSNNVAFLKSNSGNFIPVEQLQSYLNTISKEGTDFVNLSVNLPRELVGNPPINFRGKIVDILSKGSKKSASKSGAKPPIGDKGRQFKELASQKSGWIQISDIIGNMSGWKFHIYSDDLDDVAFIYEKISPIAQKWGTGMKLASQSMLNSLNQGQLQKGKGATLYLPSSVTAKNQQKQFLSEIQSALSGYNKSGNISGDKMITPNIGYRYELSKPIDQKVGVDYSTYKTLYKKNEGGGHNIPNNPDLF